jgi:hypothetical protein
MRAAGLLDPSVPLLAPSKTIEIAAASTSRSHASLAQTVGGLYPAPAVDGGEKLLVDRHI